MLWKKFLIVQTMREREREREREGGGRREKRSSSK
jgi:hypothetical protein